MKKILILGHRGMLGRAVFKYFSIGKKYKVTTTDEKWDTPSFRAALQNSQADFIINCIGKIPQKNPKDHDYKSVNVQLPIFLETLDTRVIHPSTDCEFSGDLEPNLQYTKQSTRDATDEYGKSKATISKMIEESFTNTKIIRTSIIGHEGKTAASLLDWFLSAKNDVCGYTNHYWNGITTLEWAHLSYELIQNWDESPTLNQYGGRTMSKCEVLKVIKDVYQKNISIEPFEATDSTNKCLESDKELRPLTAQLHELKEFVETHG